MNVCLLVGIQNCCTLLELIAHNCACFNTALKGTLGSFTIGPGSLRLPPMVVFKRVLITFIFLRKGAWAQEVSFCCDIFQIYIAAITDK